ncbi:MAG: hypothetical protein JKX74_03680, partial [Flavobacteriales bacterium]|nr:hypothetical protein [Flavobacteriales bacterium]
MTKVPYILVLFFAITAGPIFAQHPKFIATIDKDTVMVGEEFTITYSLDTIGTDFKPPTFYVWTLMSGNENLDWKNEGVGFS